MARIYFDSNVFSNLRKGEEPKYLLMKEAIEKYKNNLMFFFSHAHIRDKRKDRTDIKYHDFKYMESLVGDNYISYHALEKRTSFYLATPLEVFNDEDQSDELDFLLDFWRTSNEDDLNLMATKSVLKDLLESEKIETDILTNKEIGDYHKEMLRKIFPVDKTEFTMADIFDQLITFYQDFFSNSDSYKEFRKFIGDQGKTMSHSINGKDYSLTELFENKEINEKFVDYVKNSLHHQDKTQIPYYDFYLQAYSTLDFLGFSKDKLTKRNSFNNLFNDALHSYYARYCDYLITEDIGLREKSSILYKQFEVVTKVLTVDEFIGIIDSISAPTESSVIGFFKKLGADIISGPIVEKSEDEDHTIFTIYPQNRYFNFFDRLLVLKTIKEEVFVFLTKRESNYLSGANYRESSRITDRMIELFEEDIDGNENLILKVK